jgi:hypothetical protein
MMGGDFAREWVLIAIACAAGGHGRALLLCHESAASWHVLARKAAPICLGARCAGREKSECRQRSRRERSQLSVSWFHFPAFMFAMSPKAGAWMRKVVRSYASTKYIGQDAVAHCPQVATGWLLVGSDKRTTGRPQQWDWLRHDSLAAGDRFLVSAYFRGWDWRRGRWIDAEVTR